jgi:hypothetical protein
MTWYGTAVFIVKRTPQRSTVPYSDRQRCPGFKRPRPHCVRAFPCPSDRLCQCTGLLDLLAISGGLAGASQKQMKRITDMACFTGPLALDVIRVRG